MNTLLETIACRLVGWRKDILDGCSEASHAHLHKLVAALTVIMTLWGIIGYCGAERYLNVDAQWKLAAISAGFVFIVWCIERVIILTLDRGFLMRTVRIVLGVSMALIGSCIFDQLFLGNDIENKVQESRERLIQKLITIRNKAIDEESERLTEERDSLIKRQGVLSAEVSKKPTIKIFATKVLPGPDGKVKTYTEASDIANPHNDELQSTTSQINDYNTRLGNLYNDKKELQKTVRAEVSGQEIGFIEELNATFDVVTSSKAAMSFYSVLFVLMLCIELFVLTVSSGKRCDYEVLLIRQQSIIEKRLTQATEQP